MCHTGGHVTEGADLLRPHQLLLGAPQLVERPLGLDFVGPRLLVEPRVLDRHRGLAHQSL